MVGNRLVASFAIVFAAAACDAAYSVSSSDDGGGSASSDGGNVAAGDAGGAIADGSAAPAGDSSTPDGTSNDTKDASGTDASRPVVTPLTLLGARIRLWLDATDPTTVTQAVGNVSQWHDKSNNKLVAATTNGGSVTFVTDADAGGVHGVAFAGGGNMAIPDTPLLQFNKESFSIFIAARYTAAEQTQQYNDMIAKSNGGNSGYELQFEGNGNQICGELGTNANICSTSVEGFGIFELNMTAAITVGQKGTLTPSQIGYAKPNSVQADVLSDNAPFVIGHGFGGNFYFTGTIFEIIVADQPTAQDRAALAAYLEQKYGRP
jgi:hypothetical protein